jgi:tight adherence protein B
VRRFALVVAAAAAAVVTSAAGAGSPSRAGLQVTPILRFPFPSRGYVVDLTRPTGLTSNGVQVTENGVRIGDVSVSPLSKSGLRFGVVLAVDSSLTMAGTPYASALEAARSFVSHRGSNERIGIVTFNSRIRVLSAPTPSAKVLDRALARAPAVAYGTHVYDAVDVALSLLRRAKLSTGAIVLLTDGQNVGSRATLSGAVTRAYRQHVRVFTIGLRSPAFDPANLHTIATGTGGSYAEATSPRALTPIYTELSKRLANEYVVQYRSIAAPNTRVDVRISVVGFGASATFYQSPKPSGLAPFRRSLATRFFLSTASLLILALLVAGLAVYVVRRLVARPGSSVVERVSAFAAPAVEARSRHHEWRARSRGAVVAGTRTTRGMLAGLERTLEIADIRMSASAVAGLTAIAVVLAMIMFAAISPVFFPLAFAVVLVPRALVRQKLARVRNRFNEQLPANLQVLASALRAGHSFTGALASVVEQADDPSRRELRRAVTDEQLGMPVDEALRRVAERMKSRDLDQVALVAELQRTTGGNVAEVLDVVVATIRDRQDVRRVVRTLTAQGRMSRWILSSLPLVTGLSFYALQPRMVGPFYSAPVGQVCVLIAAIAVICGSLLIQRIIEVEV